MGRKYVVQTSAVAINAAQDLFEVLGASDSVTIVHGWAVMQTTDVSDAAEEILRIETVRGIGATSGSGGSTPTVQPVDDGDSAFGGTVEANNTTRMTAGGGSLETLEQWGWNIRIPMTQIYTPELRPTIGPGEYWTLSLPAAPADSITTSITLWVEELGG